MEAQESLFLSGHSLQGASKRWGRFFRVATSTTEYLSVYYLSIHHLLFMTISSRAPDVDGLQHGIQTRSPTRMRSDAYSFHSHRAVQLHYGARYSQPFEQRQGQAPHGDGPLYIVFQ